MIHAAPVSCYIPGIPIDIMTAGQAVNKKSSLSVFQDCANLNLENFLL